tara:strand:+ start:1503 stop:2078 length:576 start_codon:yes stop_codon:yes gene_type:complete
MANYSGTPIADIIAALESRPDLPVLAPDRDWDEDLTTRLNNATATDLFGDRSIADPAFAEAVRSGLLLWNDALDASHTVSQAIDTITGSYWHGIMHRREPDYGNAKYWFNRVGSHPAMVRVLALATERAAALVDAAYAEGFVGRTEWDAFQFVDWCEDAAGLDSDAGELLRVIQLEEIKVLLDYSFEQALG